MSGRTLIATCLCGDLALSSREAAAAAPFGASCGCATCAPSAGEPMVAWAIVRGLTVVRGQLYELPGYGGVCSRCNLPVFIACVVEAINRPHTSIGYMTRDGLVLVHSQQGDDDARR